MPGRKWLNKEETAKKLLAGESCETCEFLGHVIAIGFPTPQKEQSWCDFLDQKTPESYTCDLWAKLHN